MTRTTETVERPKPQYGTWGFDIVTPGGGLFLAPGDRVRIW
jgi:hypothetical protein